MTKQKTFSLYSPSSTIFHTFYPNSQSFLQFL